MKTVVLNAGNGKRGLPTINGVVTLLDGVTGQAVGLVEGNWITAVRTAGLTATAARRLARPSSRKAGFGMAFRRRATSLAFADIFLLSGPASSGADGPTSRRWRRGLNRWGYPSTSATRRKRPCARPTWW